jgi:hypothetical protein
MVEMDSDPDQQVLNTDRSSDAVPTGSGSIILVSKSQNQRMAALRSQPHPGIFFRPFLIKRLKTNEGTTQVRYTPHTD